MFVYDLDLRQQQVVHLIIISMEKSILLHRGYEIEELAENSDYPEVCYLLLNGDLPNKKVENKFIQTLTHYNVT